MFRAFLFILVALSSVPIYFLYLRSPPPLPSVDLEEWWGPTTSKIKEDKSIKPFKVEFTEVMIKDLREKLQNRRPLIPPLEGVAFEYGFNSKVLNSWVEYWAKEYPFKAREEFLNQYAHFKTNIQGLSIHFIRVKPKVPPGVEVVPLLLLHGFPGSVREFYDAIPYLSTVSKDRDFAVELIIPSIPGNGFSSAAVRPGLGADKVAVVLRNLMHRLGFKKYYMQGGNWGAFIMTIMATLFHNDILGFHNNAPFLISSSVPLISLVGSIYPPIIVNSEVQDRVYPMLDNYMNMIEESGYAHLQSTKPDTIGIALSDSPTGLAAYLLEKYSSWTNMNYRKKPDGGLTESFNMSQLLDNIMIYWATNCITTTIRIYADTFNKRFFSLQYDDIPTPVPTIVIQTKYEVAYTPISALKLKFPNLLNETSPNEGGHFLALEKPEMFSKDVINAIQTFREWHKDKKTEL